MGIRALACSSTAFVHASTEGRACWDFFDSSLSASKRFAFKCHRAVAESVGGANRPVETVFPVHDIAFHPTEGTFATVGGDGTLCVWDGSVKKRIWRTSKFDNEISGVGFSADGNHLAIAVSDAGCSLKSGDVDFAVTDPGPSREIWIK